MTVIEYMRHILMEYPQLNSVCDSIHIDFSDGQDNSYGLTSTGDKLISESITGIQTRQHNFLLYATYQSINDFDRLNNSGVLLGLAYYLDGQQGNIITADDNSHRQGVIKSVRAENGSIIEIPDGNMICGVQYQLQIAVIYELESED